MDSPTVRVELTCASGWAAKIGCTVGEASLAICQEKTANAIKFAAQRHMCSVKFLRVELSEGFKDPMAQPSASRSRHLTFMHISSVADAVNAPWIFSNTKNDTWSQRRRHLLSSMREEHDAERDESEDDLEAKSNVLLGFDEKGHLQHTHTHCCSPDFTNERSNAE